MFLSSPHLGSHRNQHHSPQPPPQQQSTRKEDLNKAKRARLVLSPSPSLPGRRWGPSTRGPTIDTWSGVGGDAGPRADHQCGAAHLCAGANPGVSPHRASQPPLQDPTAGVKPASGCLYSCSHGVAMVSAARGASIARQAVADSLLCNAACGSVMVSDHFRCTAILIGLFLMKLHCIQSRSRQRLS